MSNKDKKFEVLEELIRYSICPNDHFVLREDGGLESTPIFGEMRDGIVVPVVAYPGLRLVVVSRANNAGSPQPRFRS